jgi:two-component system chemotaxis response regulator CheB
MNETRPIRVAIVDDSAFMRIALRQMLDRAEEIEIVAEGRNGKEAVEIARNLRPDLMTLDVLMPEMDGLTALAEVMETAPCSVLMISTETQQGAETTMRALDLGAADFIAKTTDLAKLDMAWIEKNLIEKVRYWADQNRMRRRVRKPPDESRLRQAKTLDGPPDILVVAASTGGPKAVTELVGALRNPRCPVVVAQHMPEGFTADFARHLALRSGQDVVEGADGQVLMAGRITILPGGVDSRVLGDPDGGFRLAVSDGTSGVVHPSADILLESVAKVSRLAVGVVLTGMGSDGTAGARHFADRDWPVLAQEPASCVVAGMPGAVIAAGHASAVLSIAEMARQINRWPTLRTGGEAA